MRLTRGGIFHEKDPSDPSARVLRVLILAVLAVRWLTRDRLSSVNRYALWLVVLIRLLIPARALNRLAEWLLKLLLSSITTMSNGHALR